MALIQLPDNFMKFHHICKQNNGSPSCFSIKDNMNPIQTASVACQNYDSPMATWINTGNYHTSSRIGQINETQSFIAYFNECSLLPLVPVIINGFNLVATVDTGAVRTLLSSSLIQHFFPDFKSQLCTDKTFNLKDVNNNKVIVLGYMPLSISIGQCHFTYDFLIFESSLHELLLGLDFLKIHKIAIAPNKGLLFESQLINKVNNFSSTSYIVTSNKNIRFLHILKQ